MIYYMYVSYSSGWTDRLYAAGTEVNQTTPIYPASWLKR